MLDNVQSNNATCLILFIFSSLLLMFISNHKSDMNLRLSPFPLPSPLPSRLEDGRQSLVGRSVLQTLWKPQESCLVHCWPLLSEYRHFVISQAVFSVVGANLGKSAQYLRHRCICANCISLSTSSCEGQKTWPQIDLPARRYIVSLNFRLYWFLVQMVFLGLQLPRVFSGWEVEMVLVRNRETWVKSPCHSIQQLCYLGNITSLLWLSLLFVTLKLKSGRI